MTKYICETEQAKYRRAYQLSNYKMGGDRLRDAKNDLIFAAEQGCWTHLDVGCGRGEMLDYGRELGMTSSGVEIVPALAANREDVIIGGASEIVELFGKETFDLVTCFDVLEHLPPGSEVPAIQAIRDVAIRCAVVTANNKPSMNGGDNLHINIKPYDDWDSIIRIIFYGWNVEFIKTTYSPTWRAWRYNSED